MTINVILHDEGIKDIKLAVEKLAIKYKKYTKKDPNKARLQIVFKRGPITMANGEWSKLPYDKLTMDPNRVLGYFKRSNLNWGILGYGSTKGGLKELIKHAKTKLNPKQLLGENQDLKMVINSSSLIKKGEEVVGRIIISVPDKSLGGTDIQSPVLEKYGYIGINKWKEQATKLLEENELDSHLKSVLNNEQKLSDIVEKYTPKEGNNETDKGDNEEQENKKDVEKALAKLKYTKAEINDVIDKLDLSKSITDIIKQALNMLGKKY